MCLSSTWTDQELDRIGGAEELQLASERTDGSLRPYVTMWVVRAGDDLYVRSAYGRTTPGTGEPRAVVSAASAPVGSSATSPSPTPRRELKRP